MRPVLILPAFIFCTVGLLGCGRQAFDAQDPEHLVERGGELIASFSFFEAEPGLRAALARTPEGSPLWQRGQFLLALSLRHQTPPQARKIGESRRLLEQLVETAPDSPLAPDALMNLARIAELRDYAGDVPDPQRAAALYQRIIDEYADSDLADLAVLRLASQKTLDPSDLASARAAVAMVEDRIKQRPESPYLWPMWEFVAATEKLLLKDRRAALRAMIESVKYSKAAPGRRGTIYWNIAELAETLGERNVAVEYYQRLLDEVPRSLRRLEAQERLQALRGQPSKNQNL